MTTEERFKVIQSTLGGLFGNTYRQSLPLPVRKGKDVLLMVFLAPQMVKAPEGTQVFPPTHVAEFKPDTAELLGTRVVEPSFFGRNDPNDRVLGTANMPNGITFEQYVKMRSELFAAYDRLIPAFAQNSRTLAPADLQAARLFGELFPKVRESVFEDHYQRMGREFFSWLKSVER